MSIFGKCCDVDVDTDLCRHTGDVRVAVLCATVRVTEARFKRGGMLWAGSEIRLLNRVRRDCIKWTLKGKQLARDVALACSVERCGMERERHGTWAGQELTVDVEDNI